MSAREKVAGEEGCIVFDDCAYELWFNQDEHGNRKTRPPHKSDAGVRWKRTAEIEKDENVLDEKANSKREGSHGSHLGVEEVNI